MKKSGQHSPYYIGFDLFFYWIILLDYYIIFYFIYLFGSNQCNMIVSLMSFFLVHFYEKKKEHVMRTLREFARMKSSGEKAHFSSL